MNQEHKAYAIINEDDAFEEAGWDLAQLSVLAGVCLMILAGLDLAMLLEYPNSDICYCRLFHLEGLTVCWITSLATYNTQELVTANLL